MSRPCNALTDFLHLTEAPDWVWEDYKKLKARLAAVEAAFAAATAQGQRISRVLGTAHSRIAKLERELAAVNDNRYALAVLCQPSKVLVLPAAAKEVQSE
jgi:hypothetical protein